MATSFCVTAVPPVQAAACLTAQLPCQLIPIDPPQHNTTTTAGDPRDAMEAGEDAHLSYLPLAHIYERVMVETVAAMGARVGFWQVCGRGWGGLQQCGVRGHWHRA